MFVKSTILDPQIKNGNLRTLRSVRPLVNVRGRREAKSGYPPSLCYGVKM